VLKHFIYAQDGCEKQSIVVYSLNHDIMASFPLDSHKATSKPSASPICNSAERCTTCALVVGFGIEILFSILPSPTPLVIGNRCSRVGLGIFIFYLNSIAGRLFNLIAD
jgi:hypothetical protein